MVLLCVVTPGTAVGLGLLSLPLVTQFPQG